MRTLQLVIFRYKQELDQDGIPRKGELYTVATRQSTRYCCQREHAVVRNEMARAAGV